MARAAVVQVTGASTGGGLWGLPGEPHADAMALATAVRRLPKAYKLGADRVAQLVGDYAALNHGAIEAVAGAPFNLQALLIRGAILRAFDWDIGEPVPQRCGPSAMPCRLCSAPIAKVAPCVLRCRIASRDVITSPASPGNLTGGFTPLAAFKARQTGKGVSAAPWNTRRIFGGTFIIKCYGGNVYKRAGKARFPLHKLYRAAIPRELPRDQSGDAFDTNAPAVLAKHLNHEVGRLLAR